jgi:hypothetical protein
VYFRKPCPSKFALYSAEVSRAYVVRGASGDEWGELIGGKGTIGLQAAVPKKAPHATFFSPFTRGNIHNTQKTFWVQNEDVWMFQHAVHTVTSWALNYYDNTPPEGFVTIA